MSAHTVVTGRSTFFKNFQNQGVSDLIDYINVSLKKQNLNQLRSLNISGTPMMDFTAALNSAQALLNQFKDRVYVQFGNNKPVFIKLSVFTDLAQLQKIYEAQFSKVWIYDWSLEPKDSLVDRVKGMFSSTGRKSEVMNVYKNFNQVKLQQLNTQPIAKKYMNSYQSQTQSPKIKALRKTKAVTFSNDAEYSNNSILTMKQPNLQDGGAKKKTVKKTVKKTTKKVVKK